MRRIPFLLRSPKQVKEDKQLSMHVAGRLIDSVPGKFVSEPLETLTGAAFAAQMPDGRIVSVVVAVQDGYGPLTFAP